MKKVNGNLIFEVKISVDIKKKLEDNCVEKIGRASCRERV